MKSFALSWFSNESTFQQTSRFKHESVKKSLHIMSTLPIGAHSFNLKQGWMFYTVPSQYIATEWEQIYTDTTLLKTATEWSPILYTYVTELLTFSQWFALVYFPCPKKPVASPFKELFKSVDPFEFLKSKLKLFVDPSKLDIDDIVENGDRYARVVTYMSQLSYQNTQKMAEALEEVTLVFEEFHKLSVANEVYAELKDNLERENETIRSVNDQKMKYYTMEYKRYQELVRVIKQHFRDWHASRTRGWVEGDVEYLT